MHEGGHTPPRGSTAHIKSHRQKLNIHNMHTRLVGSKYVTCHATLRNEHEIRTATAPTNVKGDHEASPRSCPTPPARPLT